MRKKIIKVIFNDKTSLKAKFKDRSEFEHNWKYIRQFTSFESDLLDYIEEDVITDFAEGLGMVNEDDIENDTKELCDFNDNEILSKAFSILGGKEITDIISQDLIKRFITVLRVCDKLELEDYLKQKEIQHNL